ncbi:MAG: hypothetical protein H0X62_15345 [Bacteroidetes bacterium]|nr:hypothetical protein [Bacteroidota bacterium]
MAKNILLLFSLLVMLILQKVFNTEVTLTPNFPKNIAPGEEVISEIKIKKGSLTSYAKLQLEIPDGLTISIVDSKSASFTFYSQKAKFIWLSLPAEDEFTVSIKIKADENIQGEKQITGQLSYLRNSDKETVDLPNIIINANNEGLAQNNKKPETEKPSAQLPLVKTNLDESEMNETTPATNTNFTSGVTCSRIIKPSTVTPGEYIVEITLRTENLPGFAKLQDVLPNGFSATSIETSNAMFSFTGQKVKFVWMSLPAKDEFKVTYRINADKGITGQFFINGEFSFAEQDGETKKCILPQDAINIIAADAPTADNTPKPKAEPKPQQEPPVIQPQPKPAVKAPTAQQKPEPQPQIKTEPKTTPAPHPGGVHYRVQIEAGPKLVGQDYFKNRYKITEEVYPELHQGLNKYSVGGFDAYSIARNYREKITTNHDIDTKPFVIAYNYGQRISIQEALMITKQKWVK